jgi:hypothetical protein
LFGRLRKGQNALAGEFILHHILIAECRRAIRQQISGSVIGMRIRTGQALMQDLCRDLLAELRGSAPNALAKK